MKTHNLNYYGIDLEVNGNYEQPDESTGYKGGWLSCSIFSGNQNIMPIMSDAIIEHVDELILSQNY